MKEHSRIACRFLIFKQTGVSHLVSLVRGILFFFLTVGSKNILTQKSIFCHDGQRRNASSVKHVRHRSKNVLFFFLIVLPHLIITLRLDFALFCIAISP